MREIKFRGKLKEKGMSGWIEGSLVHITRTYKGEEDEQECDIYQIINEDGVGFFIDKETIGQFTGLYDKNGKEIYEGDVLQHLYDFCDKTDRYVVAWDNDNLQYSFENIHKRNTYMALEDFYDDYYGDYSIEVIGNIYENSDLLKGADNIE